MPVKSKVKISQNLAAFSEYMNFNGSRFEIYLLKGSIKVEMQKTIRYVFEIKMKHVSDRRTKTLHDITIYICLLIKLQTIVSNLIYDWIWFQADKYDTALAA